jgi:quinol monooxygenase YgiN
MEIQCESEVEFIHSFELGIHMSSNTPPFLGPVIKKIARITAKSGKAETLADALIEVELPTRQEKGCLEFTFYRALSKPDSFLLFEAFESQAALDLHMSLPHTKRFFAAQLVAEVSITALNEQITLI